MNPAPSGEPRERRLVDRWAKLEHDLLEASTRRIHEFERRLELEWEALRQLHEERLQTPVRRDKRLLVAVLALVVLLLGVIALVTLLHFRLVDRVADVERTARQTQEQLQQVRRESATVSRDRQALSAKTEATLASNQRVLSVLAAPDLQRFTLFGRRTDPPAAGQALWSRSRGLVIEASRVPRPPSGQVLQVWLAASTRSVSAGSVMPDPEGRISATLDAPPSLPGRVIAIVLTAEPAAGSTLPSTRVVLTSVDP